ncbi:hypothetical protein RHMOL_Rhmol06G0056100 [Rhododendron molle]|uniref:Uncharacterized protein n=1 Tax=Rhododendron molle TaxID=49168 RepID=A0ACC0NBD6_RHOML|nr:hypothetical protein RHMOL_Rhmol06G0056100 [Rhododendron molle]
MDTLSNPRKRKAKTLARMDYCTQLASQWMLKEVKKSREDNLVVSPVSLNVVLNMVATGLKGRTLETMLGFLGSENINQINLESVKMMAVAADVGSSDNGDDGLLENKTNSHPPS